MDLEITKMTAKGQITLPVAIRKRLGLKAGDKDAQERVITVITNALMDEPML